MKIEISIKTIPEEPAHDHRRDGECELLTEYKADMLVAAFQRGEIDLMDLMCMIENFDSWMQDSEAGVACFLRGENK